MRSLFASEAWTRRLEAAKSAPPEVVLYGLFSLVVCVTDFWLTFVGPQSVKAMTVPFTGWVASMPYLFGFFWVFLLVFGSDRRFALRLGLVGPLLVCAVFGIVQYAQPHGEDFGNPYLQVSPWRPIWTVIIPMLWTAVLMLAPRFRTLTVKPLPI